jgi:NAD(P)-dependent dehydrogenase (short-subunit alcohol dehydrogenase family)
MRQDSSQPHKVALIMGGNVGIGWVTAIELSKTGRQILAGRYRERTPRLLRANLCCPWSTWTLPIKS